MSGYFAPVFLTDFHLTAPPYRPAFQTVVPLVVSALQAVPPALAPIPATVCSFYSLLLDLDFPAVLSGTTSTHHRVHTLAIVKPSGIYVQATGKLQSLSFPLYKKACSKARQVLEKVTGLGDGERAGQFPRTK